MQLYCTNANLSSRSDTDPDVALRFRQIVTNDILGGEMDGEYVDADDILELMVVSDELKEKLAAAEFAPFKQKERLEEILDSLADQGYLDKDQRLGYKFVKPFSAAAAHAAASADIVSEDNFIPPAPMSFKKLLNRHGDGLVTTLIGYYLLCSAWIEAFKAQYGTARDTSQKAETPKRWFAYWYGAVSKILANKDTLDRWESIRGDLRYPEIMNLESYFPMEGMGKKVAQIRKLEAEIEKITDPTSDRIGVLEGEVAKLEEEANAFLVGYASNWGSRGFDGLLKLHDFYRPEDGRVIVENVIPAQAQNDRPDELLNTISNLVETKTKRENGKAAGGLTATQIYQQIAPQGGLKNFADFLDMLLWMAETDPNFQQDVAGGTVAVFRYWNNHMLALDSPIGERDNGADMPVGAAPNSQTQVESLMSAVQRLMPLNWNKIVARGLGVWADRLLNGYSEQIDSAVRRVIRHTPAISERLEEQIARQLEVGGHPITDTQRKDIKGWRDDYGMASDSSRQIMRAIMERVEDKSTPEMKAAWLFGVGGNLLTDEQQADVKTITEKHPHALRFYGTAGDGRVIRYRRYPPDKDGRGEGFAETTKFKGGRDNAKSAEQLAKDGIMLLVEVSPAFNVIGEARKSSEQFDRIYRHHMGLLGVLPVRTYQQARDVLVGQIFDDIPNFRTAKGKTSASDTSVAQATALTAISNLIEATTDHAGLVEWLVSRGNTVERVYLALGFKSTPQKGERFTDYLLSKWRTVNEKDRWVKINWIGTEGLLGLKGMSELTTDESGARTPIGELLFGVNPDGNAAAKPMIADIAAAQETYRTDEKISDLSGYIERWRPRALYQTAAPWFGGVSPALIGRSRKAGLGGVDMRIGNMMDRMVSLEIMFSLLEEMQRLKPDAVRWRKTLYGNIVKKILVYSRGDDRVLGLANPIHGELWINPQGGIGSVGHEVVGHFIENWAMGMVSGGYVVGSGGRRMEGETGANLYMFDQRLREKEGKPIGKDDFLLIMKALYRAPYFSQNEFASKDELLAALPLERLEKQIGLAIATTEGDKRKIAEKVLRQQIGGWVSLHRMSPLMNQLAENHAFGKKTGDIGRWLRSDRQPDEQMETDALKQLDALLTGETHYRDDYTPQVSEMFARAVEVVLAAAEKRQRLVTGGSQTHLAIIRSEKTNRFVYEQHEPQIARLERAFDLLFGGMEVGDDGSVVGFSAPSLRPLMSDVTPQWVVDEVLDGIEGVPAAKKAATAAPTGENRAMTALAKQPPPPPNRAPVRWVAYGEDSGFYIEQNGTAVPIAKVSSNLGMDIAATIAWVRGGSATAEDVWGLLATGQIYRADNREAQVPFEELAEATEQFYNFIHTNKPDTQFTRIFQRDFSVRQQPAGAIGQAADQLDEIVQTESEAPPENDEYEAPVITHEIAGVKVNLETSGMKSPAAPQPDILPIGKVAELFGVSEELVVGALFPNGVDHDNAPTRLQIDSILRFVTATGGDTLSVEGSGTTPKNAFMVSNPNHMAQTLILGGDLRSSATKVRNGYGNFIGTGGGKTHIHIGVFRLFAAISRHRADEYLAAKGGWDGNIKNRIARHEDLWRRDGEYRKIVSMGMTVLTTGGAVVDELRRGTKKSLAHLGVLREEDVKQDKIEGGILERGGFRFIDAAQASAVMNGKDLHPNEEREFIPRPGDFIYVQTYEWLSKDDLGDQRSKTNKARNQAEMLPKNIRFIAHLMGVEGALGATNSVAKGYELQPKGYRPAGFYDNEQYAEFRGQIIFDEADIMVGVVTQGYRNDRMETARQKALQFDRQQKKAAGAISKNKTAPSAVGILGRELARLFPAARVMYSTATPFKDLSSFAAFERLILASSSADISESDHDLIFPTLVNLHMGGEEAKRAFLQHIIQKSMAMFVKLRIRNLKIKDIRSTHGSVENDKIFAGALSRIVRKAHGLLGDHGGDRREGVTPARTKAESAGIVGGHLYHIVPTVTSSLLLRGEFGDEFERVRTDPDKSKRKSPILSVPINGDAFVSAQVKKELLDGHLGRPASGFRVEQRDGKGSAERMTAPHHLFGVRGMVRRMIETAYGIADATLTPYLILKQDGTVETLLNDKDEPVGLRGEKMVNFHRLANWMMRNHQDRAFKYQIGQDDEYEEDGDEESAKRRYEKKMREALEVTPMQGGQFEIKVPGRFFGRGGKLRRISVSGQQLGEIVGAAADNLENLRATEMGNIVTVAEQSGKKAGEIDSLLERFSTDEKSPLPMQVIYDRFAGWEGGEKKLLEVSGRKFRQTTDPTDPDRVVVERRDGKAEQAEAEHLFNHQKNGALLVGHPLKLSRGISLDRTAQTGNQQDRIAAVNEPGERTSLIIQFLGRHDRARTIGKPEIWLVDSQNFPALQARVAKIKNLIVEQSELLTGSGEGMLGMGREIFANPDVSEHSRTEDITRDVVRSIINEITVDPLTLRIPNPNLLGAGWDLAKISEQMGLEDRAGWRDLLSPRMALLPIAVQKKLWKEVGERFVKRFNQTPNAKKAPYLGNRINIALNIRREGTDNHAMVVTHTPAPVGVPFEAAFRLPDPEKDMVAHQRHSDNHRFFIADDANAPGQKYGIFMNANEIAPGSLDSVEDEKMVRFYDFDISDNTKTHTPSALWRRKGVNLAQLSRSGLTAEISREEAAELWRRSVGGYSEVRAQRRFLLLTGSPTGWKFTNNVGFEPVRIPNPDPRTQSTVKTIGGLRVLYPPVYDKDWADGVERLLDFVNHSREFRVELLALAWRISDEVAANGTAAITVVGEDREMKVRFGAADDTQASATTGSREEFPPLRIIEAKTELLSRDVGELRVGDADEKVLDFPRMIASGEETVERVLTTAVLIFGQVRVYDDDGRKGLPVVEDDSVGGVGVVSAAAAATPDQQIGDRRGDLATELAAYEQEDEYGENAKALVFNGGIKQGKFTKEEVKKLVMNELDPNFSVEIEDKIYWEDKDPEEEKIIQDWADKFDKLDRDEDGEHDEGSDAYQSLAESVEEDVRMNLVVRDGNADLRQWIDFDSEDNIGSQLSDDRLEEIREDVVREVYGEGGEIDGSGDEIINVSLANRILSNRILRESAILQREQEEVDYQVDEKLNEVKSSFIDEIWKTPNVRLRKVNRAESGTVYFTVEHADHEIYDVTFRFGDHQQKAGGGYNAGTGMRSGRSDYDVFVEANESDSGETYIDEYGYDEAVDALKQIVDAQTGARLSETVNPAEQQTGEQEEEDSGKSREEEDSGKSREEVVDEIGTGKDIKPTYWYEADATLEEYNFEPEEYHKEMAEQAWKMRRKLEAGEIDEDAYEDWEDGFRNGKYSRDIFWQEDFNQYELSADESDAMDSSNILEDEIDKAKSALMDGAIELPGDLGYIGDMRGAQQMAINNAKILSYRKRNENDYKETHASKRANQLALEFTDLVLSLPGVAIETAHKARSDSIYLTVMITAGEDEGDRHSFRFANHRQVAGGGFNEGTGERSGSASHDIFVETKTDLEDEVDDAEIEFEVNGYDEAVAALKRYSAKASEDN